MIDFGNYLYDNRWGILEKTLEHLWLTGISVALAILLGVSLGILLTRKTRLKKPVLGFANLIQTIPSIALLGFMIPLLGIGAFPAIVALFLYALLPIIRNTFTGITEVSPSVKEAGIGLGMTDWQVLQKVELPLALPTIFAGIRTATVINVGVATLCALIASGGLGEFIFTGIALNNTQMVLTGAIPAALLAILLDGMLGLIQRFIDSLKRFLPAVLIGGALILLILTGRERMKTDELVAGHTSEFMERQDGWRGLKALYDLPVEGVQMDAGLMYQALKNGKVDVISGYSTDGRIPAYNLRVLKDDRHYFPPYYVAPMLRADLLARFPELRSILNQLAGRIDEETMQQLNYQVDHLKRDPGLVAEEFLENEGFETDAVRTGSADLVIGGKNFTEQFILGEIFARLIENQTSLTVGLKMGLGGTKIIFEALRAGEVDLYPEYTGTGLQVLLQPDSATVQRLIRDPEAVYAYVKEACAQKFDFIWLQPLGFNNTYALMMREEQAESLGVETISDLSRVLKE